MPNDFLSQEEIDILLGKKDEAVPPAGEVPDAEGSPAPAEKPVQADSPLTAETSAAGIPPVTTGASDAAGLPAAVLQPGYLTPNPQDEEVVPPNLGVILEFPLQVSIRLGKTGKTLQEIRKFSSGTVVELDRYVHETLDIYIGGKLIARGEVVLIAENFGVKITEIMDPVERVKKLR